MADPGTGRERLAEVNRLCRALVQAHTADPMFHLGPQSADVESVLDDIAALPIPAQSIQMMAAMIRGARNQVVATGRRFGMRAPTFEEAHQSLLAQNAPFAPSLLTACFTVIELMAREPRDQEELNRVIPALGQSWGRHALLAMCYIYVSFARTVVAWDPAETLDSLLQRWAVEEELDLDA